MRHLGIEMLADMLLLVNGTYHSITQMREVSHILTV